MQKSEGTRRLWRIVAKVPAYQTCTINEDECKIDKAISYHTESGYRGGVLAQESHYGMVR